MLSWAKSRIRAMKKAKRPKHKNNNEFLPQICRVFPFKSKSSSKLSSASEEEAALMGSPNSISSSNSNFAALVDIPNSNSSSISSSSSSFNFASKSAQPKKLKSLVSAAKSDGKPSKAKKMLSKFMKRLLFFRRNSVSIPETASSSSSSMAATTSKKSATTTLLFTGKLHKTQNKQSLNFCLRCPPNRRLYEEFCYNSSGKAQQHNSHSTYNGIYLAILVIAILFGLLQGRISAMLCAFSCCFFFNAMEIVGRRAVSRFSRRNTDLTNYSIDFTNSELCWLLGFK